MFANTVSFKRIVSCDTIPISARRLRRVNRVMGVPSTGGAIHVDGTPITRFTRRSLRALMGIVSQETILLNDTVFANIAYGRSDFSLAQVDAAARAGDQALRRGAPAHRHRAGAAA